MTETWPTPYGDNPPKQWLFEPHDTLSWDNPIVIDEDGRFSAISHDWESNHLDIPDFEPFRSPSGNRSFHQGKTITDEGETVATGNISYGEGHIVNASFQERLNFKGDPRRCKLSARCVELDEYAAVCGYVIPGTTKADVAGMLRSPLSPEYIQYKGREDYAGPVFVGRTALLVGMNDLTDAQIRAKFDSIAENYHETDGSGRIVYATRMIREETLMPIAEIETVKTALRQVLASQDDTGAAQTGEEEAGASDSRLDEIEAGLAQAIADTENIKASITKILARLETMDLPDNV